MLYKIMPYLIGFLGVVGAGFSSKVEFGSGYFGIDIKIPDKNSSGINTSFYVNY